MSVVIEVRVTTTRRGRPRLTPAQIERVRRMQARIDREVRASLPRQHRSGLPGPAAAVDR